MNTSISLSYWKYGVGVCVLFCAQVGLKYDNCKMSYDFDMCNKGNLKLLQENLKDMNPHAIVSVM